MSFSTFLRKVKKTFSAKFLCAIFLLILFSCKKEPSDIGLNLISGDTLGVRFSDTTTIFTHTVRVDSVRSSQPTYVLCGNYFDPYLGETHASFFSEVFPSSTGTVNFGTSPTIDSIVLSLNYKAYYGKPAPLKFYVHQNTERIYKDSVYYSNKKLTYNAVPMASIVTEPDNNHNVIINGDTLLPQLRIKLDPSSIASILLNPANYISNEDFLKAFNGFYIYSEQTGLSGNRAIYSFNLGNSNSKIVMYYKNQDNPTKQNTYSYQMGGNTARYNFFKHDYNLIPDITLQLNSSDSINCSKTYIQGLAGLQTKLYLPYIKNYLSGGAVAINKAELVIKTDPAAFDSYYPAPPQLVVVGLDSTGKELVIADQLEGLSYYGGTYDLTKKEYRFNINRYVQQVLTGKVKDYGLMLVPVSGAVNPNRAVLFGGLGQPSEKIKLNLVFTKIY